MSRIETPLLWVKASKLQAARLTQVSSFTYQEIKYKFYTWVEVYLNHDHMIFSVMQTLAFALLETNGFILLGAFSW
jgi:hypothetical protein